MYRLIFAFLLLGLPALAAAEPAAAVNAFYDVYNTQRVQGDGIPDATVRLRFQPVLSPRLNKQLAQAAAAQGRLTTKVKNAVPPVLEGDIFTSLFEGATSWKVGACQSRRQNGPLQCGAELRASLRGIQGKACQLGRYCASGKHAARLESG